MKLIFSLFIFLILPKNASADLVEHTASKLNLINEKQHTEVFNETSRFRFNVKTGYSILNTKKNNNEDIVNLELEAQYVLGSKVALGLGVANWFEVGSNSFSNSSGTLSNNMSLSLMYALTGSLTRIKKTTINYKNQIYSKDNKILTRNQRTETSDISQGDGWRLFTSLLQMNLNKIESTTYGMDVGIAHDWQLKNGDVFQLGWKILFLNNKHINAQIAQIFIGYGLMP